MEKVVVYILPHRRSDLAVEEAVEKCDEEPLERGKEVGGVGPETEFHDGATEGRGDHVEHVGDAQEWEEHDGGFHCFPYLKSFT